MKKCNQVKERVEKNKKVRIIVYGQPHIWEKDRYYNKQICKNCGEQWWI